MSTVIHIRDVPEDVRDALVEAATSRGLTLSAYARIELQQLAAREGAIRRNAEAVRRTQDDVGVVVDRGQILTALHGGRSAGRGDGRGEDDGDSRDA